MVSVPSQEVLDRIQRLYPWMTPSLLNTYSTEWSVSDSDQLALQAVRDTAEYSATFQGNYDPETGFVRMSESDYMASKSAFDALLISVNLNPSYFHDDFIQALENEVSPTELIGRMESAYERVIQSSDEIKRYYSENYGIDMSDAAILASAINPDVGQQILDRRIGIAEIGGEAAQRGFDITTGFGERLIQAGIDKQQAASFFNEASNLIPMMQVLGERHSDINDPFNLEDVSAALLFDDPETRRRIRRYRAQEASTFTGGAQTDFVRSKSGGTTGLDVR